MSHGIDIARLVEVEMHDGNEVRIGAGSRHSGQYGRIIGTIRLKHGSGYELIVQLDSGAIETFRPFDLYPITPTPAAH